MTLPLSFSPPLRKWSRQTVRAGWRLVPIDRPCGSPMRRANALFAAKGGLSTPGAILRASSGHGWGRQGRGASPFGRGLQLPRRSAARARHRQAASRVVARPARRPRRWRTRESPEGRPTPGRAKAFQRRRVQAHLTGVLQQKGRVSRLRPNMRSTCAPSALPRRKRLRSTISPHSRAARARSPCKNGGTIAHAEEYSHLLQRLPDVEFVGTARTAVEHQSPLQKQPTPRGCPL